MATELATVHIYPQRKNFDLHATKNMDIVTIINQSALKTTMITVSNMQG